MNSHQTGPSVLKITPKVTPQVTHRRDVAARIARQGEALAAEMQLAQVAAGSVQMSRNVAECRSNDDFPAADTTLSTTPRGLGLSRRQVVAIQLLSIGRSVSGTAETLGIDRRTIQRWKEDNPAFVAELDRRQTEMFESATGKIRTTLLKSLCVIDQSLHDSVNGTKTALKFVAHVDMKKLIVPPAPRDETAIADEIVRKYHRRIGVNPATPVSEEERSLVFEAAGRGNDEV